MFSAFSPVFCVRFSADGKYLATGRKNITQIYDTKTGTEIWFGLFLVYVGRWGPWLTSSFLHSTLMDEKVLHIDALGILDVCFSPDGKLLATAGRDGVVRVSSRTFMLAIVIAVITIFEANAQHSATFGALGLGHRQEENPQRIQGSHPGDPLARFLVGWEIPCLWVGRSYNEDLGYGGRVVEDPCNRRQH